MKRFELSCSAKQSLWEFCGVVWGLEVTSNAFWGVLLDGKGDPSAPEKSSTSVMRNI